MPGEHAADRRDPDQQRPRAGRRSRTAPWPIAAEQRDDDDRREAGPGRLALAVGEPEDQQRHDHAPAADPEQAAEGARRGGDHGQLQGPVAPGIRRDTRAAMAADPILEPLRAEPGDARRSSATSTGPWPRSSTTPRRAAVPAPSARGARRARRPLPPRRLRHRAPRRAPRARMVGLDRAHLRRQPRARAAAPGRAERRASTPGSADRGERGGRLRRPASTGGGSTRVGLRLEDKGPIQAIHWRGAADPEPRQQRAGGDRGLGGRAGAGPAPGPHGARAAAAGDGRQGDRDVGG